MKIFTPPESNQRTEQRTEGAKKSGKVGKRSKAAPSEKAALSDRDIREKLAAHVETSNTSKSQTLKKNAQAFGAGFMNSEVKPKALEIPAAAAAIPEVPALQSEPGKSLKESHLLMSDVQLNDPKDTNTQEKLKSVLRNGAFSFNPKEKETLEKILADR